MRIRKKYQVIPTNAKLENGDSVSDKNGYVAEYINNHSVVVSSTEPTGNARKKVWLQHSNNLLDEIEWQQGTIDGSGTEGSANNRIRSEYISVQPNTIYTFTGIGSIKILVYEYTNAEVFVKSTFSTFITSFPINFTTSSTTYKLRIVIGYNDNANLTPSAISTIKPSLLSQIDKSFILNSNNEYEEYTPQNEIYSTDEQVIGTWTDGKPLYRKVITGTLGAAGSTSYTYSNILPGTIILHNISGTTHSSSNKDTRPAMTYLKTGGGDEYYISYLFPQNSSTGNYNLLWFYSTEYSGFSFELTIEYTKTTD